MKCKKIILLGTICFALFTLTGCDEPGSKAGKLVYDGKFEIISEIGIADSLYEMRDRNTGVHYIVDYGTDAFCPLYTSKGQVKVTKISNKYVEVKQ